MMGGLEGLRRRFDQVWLIDFEFKSPRGSPIEQVHCLVAREPFQDRTLRLWADELLSGVPPALDLGRRTAVIAYYASAEMAAFRQLGWPQPANILDLYAEFRLQRNGLRTTCGFGLLGAQVAYGIEGGDTVHKDAMRDLAVRGSPFSADERRDLVEYCEQDVVALERLLPHLTSHLVTESDWVHALLRGRYMYAVAAMEETGVPIDGPLLDRMKASWPSIKTALIDDVNTAYGVYDASGTFKLASFARYLAHRAISGWPTTASGQLSVSDDTFARMARLHPELGPLRELRGALSKLRAADLEVGPDRRNRTMLSAYRSKTGRNQPSTSKFVFGQPRWVRPLIRPERNMGLAYVDWSRQEFGIAAALSGDQNMCEAYRSGDPYLAMAKLAGHAPEDATRTSHGTERALFKVVALATQYGATPFGIAEHLGVHVVEARALHQDHREMFPVFWAWLERACDFARLTGGIHTAFGWRMHVNDETRQRTLMNWPMQSNGSDMMRIAACMAVEAGIRVCCPVHDAFLVEAEEQRIEQTVLEMQDIMGTASEIVLGGFRLATEAEVISHPGRYGDARNSPMWNTVMALLREGGGAGGSGL